MPAQMPTTTVKVGSDGSLARSFTAESSSKRMRISEGSDSSSSPNSPNSPRDVDAKVKRARDDMIDQDAATDQNGSALYVLFSNLQAVTSSYGIDLPTPELVVVGMQSDGKSTFIEALLGFQFNIVDTNIGTRRPLILQMINDATCSTPRCRFRREDATVQSKDDKDEDDDTFEVREVPVNQLAREIADRTDRKAGFNKGSVSDAPIVLRVRYDRCANLTIYDTPGFRLTGDEKLRVDIEEMVMKLISPPHRIIVCLEQATVEWANTNSRQFVQRVDPLLARTVLVRTKFDNRIKELRDAESANVYMAGEGLPNGARPFFVSLPVHRNLADPTRFGTAIRECHLSDFRTLLEVGFDETLYGPFLGFARVRRYVEELLKRHCLASLQPTLQKLDAWLHKSDEELTQLSAILGDTDSALQRSRATNYAEEFPWAVMAVIQGSSSEQVLDHGQTLAEERAADGAMPWPDSVTAHADAYDIPYAEQRLVGGAQLKRLLLEFDYMLLSVPFDAPCEEAIAAASRGMWNVHAAAVDIAKERATRLFRPFVRVLAQRTRTIMLRAASAALSLLNREDPTRPWRVAGACGPFVAMLRSTYDACMADRQAHVVDSLVNDFTEMAQNMDWDGMFDMQGLDPNPAASPDHDSSEDLPARVRRLMDSRYQRHLQRQTYASNEQGTADRTNYTQAVTASAESLFNSMRILFAHMAKMFLASRWWQPVCSGMLARHIRAALAGVTDEDIENMFNQGIEIVRERHGVLQEQYDALRKQRDRFKDIIVREAEP